ncbi:hypothetical protein F4809DRAFT_637508 [Biscogniauxia mediterranea]|nr:hypothetical protein F4809DRAFT_637508 [Biscogniauxia mediterranea]
MAVLNLIVSIAGSLLLTLSYHLAFHPLRRYPGPLLGKLSNVYGGYHSLTKRYHLTTWKNHQKYDIYQNPRISEPYAYEKSRLAPNPTLFDTLETDLHRRKRKILSQATSERWMRLFEPTMLEQVDIFLKELMVLSSLPVNMTDRCGYLAVDVVGHLAFGYPLNFQTQKARRPVPNTRKLSITCIRWPRTITTAKGPKA